MIWYIPKGGLKVNAQAQAIDPKGNPVPGLYCAGSVANQVVGQYYPGSGTLNGQALIFGRIAGQNSAAEKLSLENIEHCFWELLVKWQILPANNASGTNFYADEFK